VSHVDADTMNHRTIDNINFWKLVARYCGAQITDNYGTSPCLPAGALLEVCRRLFAKK